MPLTLDFATKDEARTAYSHALCARTKAVREHGSTSMEANAALSALNAIRTRGIELFATPEVPGCATCADYSVFGGPRHTASPSCQSGRRAHCSCDTCW